MHLDWSAVLTVVVAVAVAILRQAIATPSDSERAQHLQTLADDAAAVVLNLDASRPAADMVKDVVAKVAASPSVPTQNPQRIEAAATAALVRLGKVNAK